MREEGGLDTTRHTDGYTLNTALQPRVNKGQRPGGRLGPRSELNDITIHMTKSGGCLTSRVWRDGLKLEVILT